MNSPGSKLGSAQFGKRSSCCFGRRALLLCCILLLIGFNRLLAITPSAGSSPRVSSAESLLTHPAWTDTIYMLANFWTEAHFSQVYILTVQSSEQALSSGVGLVEDLPLPNEDSVFSQPIIIRCPDLETRAGELPELCELYVQVPPEKIKKGSDLNLLEVRLGLRRFAWIDCDLLSNAKGCSDGIGTS